EAWHSTYTPTSHLPRRTAAHTGAMAPSRTARPRAVRYSRRGTWRATNGGSRQFRSACPGERAARYRRHGPGGSHTRRYPRREQFDGFFQLVAAAKTSGDSMTLLELDP